MTDKKIETLEEAIEFAVTKQKNKQNSKNGSMSPNMVMMNAIRECLGLNPLWGDD